LEDDLHRFTVRNNDLSRRELLELLEGGLSRAQSN
jgi:hypothetical protein